MEAKPLLAMDNAALLALVGKTKSGDIHLPVPERGNTALAGGRHLPHEKHRGRAFRCIPRVNGKQQSNPHLHR